MKCTSCGSNKEDYAVFSCPGCGSEKIARCKSCRKNVTPYRCPACAYEGP